jgi:protein-disulfide isomerase
MKKVIVGLALAAGMVSSFAWATSEGTDVECKCDKNGSNGKDNDKDKNSALGSEVSPTIEQVEVGRSPSDGSEHSKVTVVMFSDFQCPYSAKASKVVNTLRETYGSRVRFVFKNRPLPFHEQAPLAAKAALAANLQGRFWAFHDKVFAHSEGLERKALEHYAHEVGLDMARFRDDLDYNADLGAQLADDAAMATRLNVMGTPTFFINGHRLVGAQPIEVFTKAIDAELQKP